MQTHTPIPLIINGIHINAQLDTSAQTGLTSLFSNAAFVSLVNNAPEHRFSLPLETVSRLQSDIQTTADVLSDTLTALSFAVLDDCEHITPQIFASYAATVGELLPFLNFLSNELGDRTAP